MSAYLVVSTRPLDAALYERYRELAAPSMAAHGGRYLARGGALTVLEGDWPAQRSAVVVQFASRADAERWYRSQEYAAALVFREAGAMERTVVLVDGVDGVDGVEAVDGTGG